MAISPTPPGSDATRYRYQLTYPGSCPPPGGSWDGTPLLKSALHTALIPLRYDTYIAQDGSLCSCTALYNNLTNTRYFCFQSPYSAPPAKRKKNNSMARHQRLGGNWASPEMSVIAWNPRMYDDGVKSCMSVSM